MLCNQPTVLPSSRASNRILTTCRLSQVLLRCTFELKSSAPCSSCQFALTQLSVYRFIYRNAQNGEQRSGVMKRIATRGEAGRAMGCI